MASSKKISAKAKPGKNPASVLKVISPSPASKFKVGDPVKWSSQAGGSTTKKEGTVIAVIEGGCGSARKAARIMSSFKDTHRSAYGGGSDRPGVSYIVSVAAGKSSKAKDVLYWPIAKNLIDNRPRAKKA